ncbi:alpha/beta hydrolase family protein [Nonomuraea rhizosphaerae]|uniref:alpha/beta hydrolase family protein n=1 Tax=Nonomuraea rhizosphaerae TaxID=2665663 RepID=UPI001C601A04|nr:alpha/beta hydrolase family protein [Nonomuraea rhizosphaerae]
MRIQGKIAMLAALTLTAAGPLTGPAAHADDPAPEPQAQLVPAWDNPGPQGSTSYEDGSPAAENKAAAWHCYLYVSDPSFVKYSGRWHVEGTGRQSCTGSGYAPQGPRLTLQRYFGLGIWRNVVRTSIAWSRGSYAEMRKAWNCTGSGSEEYRWVVDGFAEGSGRKRAHAYSLYYLRVIC